MRAVSTLVLGAVLCASSIAHAQDPQADVPEAPSLRPDVDVEVDGVEERARVHVSAGTAPTAPEPPSAARGTYVSPGAIVGFVASGVGLVTFATAGGLAIGEDLRLRNACASLCYRGAGDDLRTFALLSDLGLGLTIFGAALAVVFLLADRGPRGSGVVSVAPVLDAQGGGLLVRGRL